MLGICVLILLERMVRPCSFWVQANLVRCCDTFPFGFCLEEHFIEVGFDCGVFLFYRNNGICFRKKTYHFLSAQLSLLSQTYTKEKGNLKYQIENYLRRARSVIKPMSLFLEQLKAKVIIKGWSPNFETEVGDKANNVELTEDMIHIKQFSIKCF